MLWEKKICIRLTVRRIVGAILAAATVVNLAIVGVVFGAATMSVAPTFTPTSTSPPAFITSFVPTSTEGLRVTLTLTTNQTPTQTSSVTPTQTSTPTSTQTVPPTSTPCTPWYAWPIYIVQSGDTLSTLARLTGSSSGELMLANCLPNDLIYVGQLLYVPRLPVKPLTVTPSATLTETRPVTITVTPTYSPTNTPTNITSATPTDTPYLLFQQQ